MSLSSMDFFYQKLLPLLLPIIGSVFLAPLFLFLRDKFTEFLNHKVARIKIRVSDPLIKSQVKFGLLKVRENSEEVINKEYKFVPDNSENTLHADVNYNKKTGFVFKCFAVCNENISHERLIAELKKLGYPRVSERANHHGRVWFILPDYPTKKRKFLNNVYMPY